MLMTLSLLVLLLLSLALLEYAILKRQLHRIRIRIHVNGTRGKSTVTRLIAAGLRAGGHRAIAKTTGTEPRLILEDGSEVALRRRGRATIREQMRTVSLAVRRQADALVVECMAIHPELQWVSEHRMIHATIGVITNVRQDHMEVFGSDRLAMARALSRTIPAGGVLVTAERSHSDLLREVAAGRGTRAVLVEDGARGALSSGADHRWLQEDEAIALAVCREAGIPWETAWAGMRGLRHDPGALQVCRRTLDGKTLTFANAFSVNDPDSLALVWDELVGTHVLRGPVVVVLNCREDRPLRSVSFARVLARDLKPERVLLVGRTWRLARREVLRWGYDPSRVEGLPRASGESVLRILVDRVPGDATVLGLGNYSGLGREIAAQFVGMEAHVC